MEVTTPPLLRLNDDCLVHVAEAVAALDLQLMEKREYFPPYPAIDEQPKHGPGPLLAFSMINKEIRSKIEFVVFRSVFLRLDEHYLSSFQRGMGLIDLYAGRDRFERAMRWPKDLICHARALSLKCDVVVGWDPRAHFQPKLLPLAIMNLLQTPRTLKRLNVNNVPLRLLEDIKIYATYSHVEPLEHVEELVVSLGAEFFMFICPNTTKLYISKTNTPGAESYDEDVLAQVKKYHGEHEEQFYRYASALTKLRSLHTSGRMMADLALSKLHANFSRLEHVYFESTEIFDLMSRYTIFDVIRGFPHLRTFTVDQSLAYKQTLNDGRDVCDDDMNWDSELWRIARNELAEDLLHSGHPTLEVVEVPVRPGWTHCKDFDLYARYVRGAEEREIKMVACVSKTRVSTIYLEWHAAIIR